MVNPRYVKIHLSLLQPIFIIFYNNIWNVLIKSNTADSTGNYWMTHCFFMTLIHEIPDIDRSISFSNYNYSWSERTERSTSN